MKKLLALILIIGCVFAMTSCYLLGPRPEKDLKKAKENLEAADYNVSYTTEAGDDIVARLSAQSEDGEDTIIIIEFANKKAANLYYRERKLEIEHEIDDLKLQIDKLKYEMKNSDNDGENLIGEIALEKLQEELSKLRKEIVLGKSGKVVWYGTKNGAKASKG